MPDGIRKSCLNCLCLQGIEFADHPIPVIKCPEGIREYDKPCDKFTSGLKLVPKDK